MVNIITENPKRHKPYLEIDDGNASELSGVWECHTINFSNGATAFKEAPNIILIGVVWDASNINFCRDISVFFTATTTGIIFHTT